MIVKVIDPNGDGIFPAELVKTRQGFDLNRVDVDCGQEEEIFISPGWIDFHTHVFHGMTTLGVNPDQIGINSGVHLLIDAGSSGAETVAGFVQYVAPSYKTKIKAFLNISSIGLTTMREYADIRNIDVDKTVAAIKKYRDFICGVKVRSSAIIVEDKGLLPFQNAIKAAEKANVPVMVHMGETPPINDSNLALFRRGDVLSHCFHGKNEPLFGADGFPIPEMKKAMERGIILDVAHGAASMDKNIAKSVIGRGYNNFIISTDIHIRNVNGPVYSLALTMTKFLALGMDLKEVISSVTLRPARALGLNDWCRLGKSIQNATLFKVRGRKESDLPLMDSMKNVIEAEKVIEPNGIIYQGELIKLC
jgi:dihydroorotase